MTIRIAAPLLLVLLLAGACASTPSRGPYTANADTPRNPLEAQRLTSEALEVIERDPAKAERLLRQALDADLFYGPAHNNLGVLLLQRGDLYRAAGEFEWARTLIPGVPDPRLNLALTLERAGRIDDAIDEYVAALEVRPDSIQSIQALTRCRLRHRPDEARDALEMHDHLRQIALRGEDEQWRQWARRQLAVEGPG